MRGDIEEQCAEVSERVFEQRIVVIQHSNGIVLQIIHVIRDDHDLAECKADALPQRVRVVRRGHRAPPPREHFHFGGDAVLQSFIQSAEIRLLQTHGSFDLIGDPFVKASPHHLRDIGKIRIRAEGSLIQKTNCGFCARLCGRIREQQRGSAFGFRFTQLVVRAFGERYDDAFHSLAHRVAARNKLQPRLAISRRNRNRRVVRHRVIGPGNRVAAQREIYRERHVGRLPVKCDDAIGRPALPDIAIYQNQRHRFRSHQRSEEKQQAGESALEKMCRFHTGEKRSVIRAAYYLYFRRKLFSQNGVSRIRANV